ncbi:MAG: deoxyguanosinetriphosphate triphosphohydrolase [Actinobacteria bacterium]|nr:deoxyguanosinetriphosphate triphosphohydrolase [Actinomycetota bacterium]
MVEKTTREILEEEEKRRLSPFAQLSVNSRGRQVPIEPCPLRTDYQRDRDRIIHSKAFRRLTHKTQVFLAPEGDHYRTRLTHTLEVSQISRSIARVLKLNEDLTEAIALGHDLGHTPFGHIGEEALTEVFRKLKDEGYGEVPPELCADLPDAFRHNEQSLRVVDIIEYEGKGLNLVWEVRDGILNHTGRDEPATLEGQIVRIADRIAYINHDIDDALRAGVLMEEELPPDLLDILGRHHGQRINNMVNDLVKASRGKRSIGLSEEFTAAMLRLREFMFDRVYLKSSAKTENPRAKKVLSELYFFFLDAPERLPREFHTENASELPRKVCDYVAGMTDRFAIKTFEKIFIPRAWMV